jgi:chromosome segregation ATPase
MRENWTDSRLDDLNAKVDRIDQRVDALGRHIDARFDAQQQAMNARFDSLQRTLFQAAITMSIAFLTAGAAIVATQL